MMRNVNTLLMSIAVCGVLLTFNGCSDSEEYLEGYEPIQQTAPPGESADRTPPRDSTTAPAGELSGDPTVARFLGLEAPKPETWTEEPPPNQMVETNLVVPAPEGREPANINVFFFGQGMGGPVEDNIQRWAGQFRAPDGGPVEPIVENFEVDGMPVALVELSGAYQGMGDPQPKPDQLMLSAIIDAPPGRLFIRLVGESATVEHNREDYMTFLRGLRRIEN